MRRLLQLGLALLALGGLATTGRASTLHDTHKWAWSESAGYLNFKATNDAVSSAFAATVQPGLNGYLTGWAWSEMLGWIKLGNTNGGLPYANTDATNGGVNVAGSNLSGFAWSESAGWINFAPTSATVSTRVTFNVANGYFEGFAWSESFGWIHLRGVGATPLYAMEALTCPLAGPITLWRATNEVLKVTDLMMLTNAVDPEGAALSVIWVSPGSTNGGAVALAGRWTTYTPPGDDDTADYFSFRIRNSIGGEAESLAEVRVLTPSAESQTMNISTLAPSASNTVVRFIGIPGRSYDVQSTTNLMATPWQKVGAITLGPQGHVLFTDTNAPAGQFYRTARP